MSDVRRSLRLVNKEGLHARPSLKIVQTASRFDAEVTIEISEQVANAKSIMEVMMLASPLGTPLEVRGTGPEAEAAVAAIAALVQGGFGEELA